MDELDGLKLLLDLSHGLFGYWSLHACRLQFSQRLINRGEHQTKGHGLDR